MVRTKTKTPFLYLFLSSQALHHSFIPKPLLFSHNRNEKTYLFKLYLQIELVFHSWEKLAFLDRHVLSTLSKSMSLKTYGPKISRWLKTDLWFETNLSISENNPRHDLTNMLMFVEQDLANSVSLYLPLWCVTLNPTQTKAMLRQADLHWMFPASWTQFWWAAKQVQCSALCVKTTFCF